MGVEPKPSFGACIQMVVNVSPAKKGLIQAITGCSYCGLHAMQGRPPQIKNFATVAKESGSNLLL